MLTALAFAALLQRPDLGFGQAVPDEHLNQSFASKEGWVGADGAFSVPLTRTSTLWLFSDTWIGRIERGARTDVSMVNNTAARMDGGNVDFVVGRALEGKPTSLLKPADGVGGFWLGPAAVIGRNLYVLLNQIVKNGDSGAFGFRPVGQWLGVGKLPGLDPKNWKFRQTKVPFARYEPHREVSFSFSLCRVGSWMYVYGADEDVLPSWRDRYLVVARCPAKRVAEFSTWRFWTGKEWSRDSKACARTVNHMASDGSVSYLPRLRRYVLVYTEDGLSPRILARTAKSPEGPWSPPTEVYKCPEGAERGVFCYGARNHPELAHGNELVVSYCTNAFELAQVLNDARLYFPRFVRVAAEMR